jgi:hypothetical protein
MSEPSAIAVRRVLGWHCSGSGFYRPQFFSLKSQGIFKKLAMFNNRWIFKMRFGQSWPTTALHATDSMIKGVKPIFDSIWNRPTQLTEVLIPGVLIP